MDKEINNRKYIGELLFEISKEKQKIRDSFPIDDCRIPIIDLTRSIDNSFVYTHFVLSEDNDEFIKANEVYQFISAGFYNSLNSFFNNSINKSGIPLIASDKESINWSNDINLRFGHIGFIEKFVELTKQGLFKINKKDNVFFFKNIASNTGRESLGTEDFYWWQRQIFLSKNESRRLKKLKISIKKQLWSETNIWREDFIKYGCTEQLDEYYEIIGRLYKRRLIGSDAFVKESNFGNLKFEEIVSIIEALIGYSIKHKDHCLTLSKKTKYKINPWNIYTMPDRLDDLAYAISLHKELDYQKVFNFLEIFSIDEKDIGSLGDSAGNSTPPLIRIAKDHVLKSVAGTLSNPFSFLVRSLKHHYENDYFKAVNHREEVFKNELYDLFELDHILRYIPNINLKIKGRLLTDIDALLYDTNTNTVFLVQLKWLDDFGHSMKKRFSMSKNFYSSSVKWIDRVEEWLNEKSISELFVNIGLGNGSEIKNIELLVLGRNFSHFSDQKEDKRAIWCSWYKLVRTVTENKPCRSDLKLLANYLRENSLQNEPVESVEDKTLQIGKFKVNISI